MGIIIRLNFAPVGQTVAEIQRFDGFKNGDRPPYWIFQKFKF